MGKAYAIPADPLDILAYTVVSSSCHTIDLLKFLKATLFVIVSTKVLACLS